MNISKRPTTDDDEDENSKNIPNVRLKFFGL